MSLTLGHADSEPRAGLDNDLRVRVTVARALYYSCTTLYINSWNLNLKSERKQYNFYLPNFVHVIVIKQQKSVKFFIFFVYIYQMIDVGDVCVVQVLRTVCFFKRLLR